GEREQREQGVSVREHRTGDAGLQPLARFIEQLRGELYSPALKPHKPPERDTTRVNDRIRVPEVRLIDDEGNQVGVLKTEDALRFAQERELDLVEVAPEARPPVARVLDYSKYKYEQAQKQKQARKHQQ